MASISIRRVYEPVRRRDGARILVDRIWPRGMTKKSAHINRWIRGLAPSSALRQWFGHKPERWREFQRRYRAELRARQGELHQLRLLARRRSVTLVYSARDTAHNQAVVLRSILQRSLRRERNRHSHRALHGHFGQRKSGERRTTKRLHRHH